jgi:hypothetical protein
MKSHALIQINFLDSANYAFFSSSDIFTSINEVSGEHIIQGYYLRLSRSHKYSNQVAKSFIKDDNNLFAQINAYFLA